MSETEHIQTTLIPTAEQSKRKTWTLDEIERLTARIDRETKPLKERIAELESVACNLREGLAGLIRDGLMRDEYSKERAYTILNSESVACRHEMDNAQMRERIALLEGAEKLEAFAPVAESGKARLEELEEFRAECAKGAYGGVCLTSFEYWIAAKAKDLEVK